MPREPVRRLTLPSERREPTTGPPRRRSRGRVVLSVTLWIVIAVGTLTFAASLAVPLWFQARDQRLLVVTSGSMSPVFDAGDAVVMRKVDDPSQLKVGQIVSFWPLGSEQLVTHRIVDLVSLPRMEADATGQRMVEVLDPRTGEPIMSQYIITKGDANDEADPNATPYTRVRGIVLAVHPGWGWVLQWTASAVGRAVMLVPPLLALGTLELLAIRDARKRPKRRPEPDERFVDAYLQG